MRTAQNATQELKFRAGKVVGLLRGLGVSIRKEFVSAYPNYNNLEGITKLDNVTQMKQADEEITAKLENLYDNLKNS